MARKFRERHSESEESMEQRITQKLQQIRDIFQAFPSAGDELEVTDGEKYRVMKRDFHLVDHKPEMELTVEMFGDSTEPVTGGPGH